MLYNIRDNEFMFGFDDLVWHSEWDYRNMKIAKLASTWCEKIDCPNIWSEDDHIQGVYITDYMDRPLGIGFTRNNGVGAIQTAILDSHIRDDNTRKTLYTTRPPGKSELQIISYAHITTVVFPLESYNIAIDQWLSQDDYRRTTENLDLEIRILKYCERIDKLK